MSEVDINYELKVLKMMLNKYLDENVSVTEESLKVLEANRDQVVWKLATKIYSQSGHKVEFCTARDVVNSRIEVINAKLTAEKKRMISEKLRMGCLNENDIFIKVQRVLSEHLGVGENEVHLDSHIANDLGADSFDVVDLVMALEEEFGIKIPDTVAEEISTVQSAVTYIINAIFPA